MTPLKIHNCASYALMEYLTCWKCVIFHAVTASCFDFRKDDSAAEECRIIFTDEIFQIESSGIRSSMI